MINLKEKQALFEMINSNEGLLGILLGYGVESSMQYKRRDLMWKSMLPILYEEINLQAVSKNHPSYSSFILGGAHPIQFVGNPQSLEVKAILQKNEKEREYIQEVYSKGNFLEITLQKLMEK